MNTAAKMAVARDKAVPAPRAPNTVPEAPAPKPAPASAPFPRWISTSRMITIAQKNCTKVNARRNIENYAPQRRTAARIARNSSAFSEAPPIRPPSTSGIANNSAAFPALTLPP